MERKSPQMAEHEQLPAGEPLHASRLVGFSDGVFAITLLVLNLQVPTGSVPLRLLLRQQAPGYVMFVVTFVIPERLCGHRSVSRAGVLVRSPSKISVAESGLSSGTR
jgi:hypothetical protein